VFALLTLIAFVLAIAAFRRANEQSQRLAALQAEVEQLRRLLDAATQAFAERRAAAAAPSTPEPAPPREPEPAMVVPPPAPPRAAEAAPPPVHATPLEPPPFEPPPPAEPPMRIDWERLAGVRGAAILGGVALALAGLLLFKYGIEHGLFPPWLRVVTGVVVGIGAIAASEWRLRRDYATTADALAGGGIVVLYASFWAASALYGLVPMAAGFVLMVAVTAACCALAWRHASLVIAMLGLVGGFATPLLVSSGGNRPIGLFGYLLLLDVALLVLAQRRRWPALALLSLGGTLFYEALWIAARMTGGQVGLGLGILGVFALVFAAAGRLAPEEDRGEWRPMQAAGVLLPFAFVFYFAANLRLQPSLHQTAALLMLLSAGASWLARVQGPPMIALGAAAASLAVVSAWALMRPMTGAWPLVTWSCALAALFHAFVEREPDATRRDAATPPAFLAAAGFLALLILAAIRNEGLWPWVAGFAVLAGLLVGHGRFAGREFLHLVAAAGVAMGVTVIRLAHETEPWFPASWVFMAVAIAAAVAFQLVALLRRSSPAAREAEKAAALVAIGLLLPFVVARPMVAQPVLLLGATLLLGLLAGLAAVRLGEGVWLLAAMAATALVHSAWTVAVPAGWPGAIFTRALAIEAMAVVVFTAVPFLAAPRLREDGFAWPAAALAGPAWFLALRRLYVLRFGDETIGLLPIALGAVALVAVSRARVVWGAGDPRRTSGLAWFAAIALSFATVAIPLQLEREWITIGWALEGLAVLVLWTRLDHPGLKYFGVALLGAATARLIANPAVLGYYPRPAWRIVNWLLYTYLVPAAALLGASRVLAPHEVPRARAWEREVLYARGWPVGAFATGIAGLLLVFVWINLAIADWFATGTTLVVSFDRLPARDLAMSIAWALYALLLLAIGMARRSIGLRWVSLGLLLVTIVKVFLYDLGELRDLYRVASLFGLAVSLMLVSLAYQRFVFRNAPVERT
jgi:uncharacterized membrane protein